MSEKCSFISDNISLKNVVTPVYWAIRGMAVTRRRFDLTKMTVNDLFLALDRVCFKPERQMYLFNAKGQTCRDS